MGSPRHARNRRRRTRECPEPACVQTPLMLGWHTQGREGWINILPWYLQWVAQGGKNLAARKGKWSPRGTGTTVLFYPCPSQPCFGGSEGCARVTKTVNIQVRWAAAQPDKTVGSRVWWHTQGSGGRPASNLGWWSSSKTAPGSLSTGSPAGRTPPHGDGSMYSQANVRAGKVLRPLIRALPSRSWSLKRWCGKRMGPLEEQRWLLTSGGKVIAPGCASKVGRVSRWGARRSQATQIYSYASSNKDSRSKSSSGKRMGESWKDSGVGQHKSQK